MGTSGACMQKLGASTKKDQKYATKRQNNYLNRVGTHRHDRLAGECVLGSLSEPRVLGRIGHDGRGDHHIQLVSRGEIHTRSLQ